jgi:hypothetical protein
VLARPGFKDFNVLFEHDMKENFLLEPVCRKDDSGIAYTR